MLTAYPNIKHAPSVIKHQKETWIKMNKQPLQLEEFTFYYKTKFGRDKAVKSFLGRFSSKYIFELKVGMYVDYRTDNMKKLPFIIVKVKVRNGIKFMGSFAEKNLVFALSDGPIVVKLNNKNNAKFKYLKCIKDIKKQLSKLTDSQISTLEKNFKLRDTLIKKVKKNTTYHLSLIDSMIIDNVMKIRGSVTI